MLVNHFLTFIFTLSKLSNLCSGRTETGPALLASDSFFKGSGEPTIKQLSPSEAYLF